MNNAEILLTQADDVRLRIHQARYLLAVGAHNRTRREAADAEDAGGYPRMTFDTGPDPVLDAALERQDLRHMELKDGGR